MLQERQIALSSRCSSPGSIVLHAAALMAGSRAQGPG
jgi:hypothetical protein